MPLCQLSSFISTVPGCSDFNLYPWGDVAYTCMYGQLHCVEMWALFSICFEQPNPAWLPLGKCRHWSLSLIRSQPDRAAHEGNYPLVLLQHQWVTACAELTHGVLARAVSLQPLLFSSACCCGETVCVVCANPFLEQWASFCISLWLFLRLKLKITLLPKLHLALSAGKGRINQARTGSYIPVIYCLLSQQVMQNVFQTYATAQIMNA